MKFERYLIVFLLIAATVVLSFFVPPFMAAVLIPAVSFGAIIIGNPRVVLFLYLGLASIYPYLNYAIPSSPIITYLDEMMSIVLFSVFFGHLVFRRIELRGAKKFANITAMMIFYAALTWLINRGSLRAAAQCVMTYFSFIPFYYLSLKYLKKGDFKFLWFGTFIFFWVNFAMNLGWRLGINPLYNHVSQVSRTHPDLEIGTLAACNQVGYFCIMFFFLLVSTLRWKQVVPEKWKRIIILTLVTLMFQLYGTFTNHAYILFGIAIIPYLWISGLWKRWQVVVLAGAAAGVIFAALAFSEQIQQQFSKENIRYRSENFSRGAKAQLFNALLIENRKDDPFLWAFGAGPGNGIGDVGKNNLSPLALNMLLPIYMSTQMEQEQTMQMTSISGNTTSAVLTFWSDFGLVGFLIFTSFYVWLFGLACRYRLQKGADPQNKLIAEFLVGAVLFYLLQNILIDTMGADAFTIWIWAWAALLTLPEDKRLVLGIEGSSLRTQDNRMTNKWSKFGQNRQTNLRTVKNLPAL
jgi:hypothetical protein